MTTQPTEAQQQNAVRTTFREILKLGFSANDAQQGKKDEQNALFFHSNGDTTKNKGRDQWLFTTESPKQVETIAKAVSSHPAADKTPSQDLVGLSFSDGKDRLDIKEADDNSYVVRRSEDHPFLPGKKSLRSEKWNAEDLHAAINAGMLAQVETYAYTSRQFPYELQEMNLRSQGLIDITRTDSGSLLTFDRPVTRTGLHLDSLSPTPETEAKIQKLQSADQTLSPQAEVPLQQQEKPSPILKQFLELKAKHPDALMLFRVGDFYETYMQDAQKASTILGITLTRSNSRKGPDGKPLEMAGFPHHALDSYLPKLIRAGQRVAICDQLPDPKLTRNMTKQKDETDHRQPPSQAEAPLQQPAQERHASAKDIVSKIDEVIGKNLGIGISPEPPIMAATAKGVAFEVNRVVREKDGSIRLYGNDVEGKERSVNALKADEKTLGDLLSTVLRTPRATLSETMGQQTGAAQQKDDKGPQAGKDASLGSEARKILSLSKVHTAAKKDHPEEMVFIRLRDFDTKRFMYQTFNQDAELLAQKVSPSVEIMRPTIKDKQYPTVSLHQEDLATLKADMMTHNILPVIINAKGERIDNDHFLAFSPEDRQAFVAQQQAQQQPNAQQPKGEDIPSPAATGQKADPADNASGIGREKEKRTGKNTQLTLDFTDDTRIQYDVHKNSHVAGMFDLRLYVNGEKAGAHRLSKEDRDKWFAHQFPITDLMMKYFPKELANANLDNLSLYKADQKQDTTQQQPPSAETKGVVPTKETKTEKEILYEERAAHHQSVAERLRQQGKDAIVLLQMHSKDGKEFFQTFNKDADFVADILGRKTILSGENKYVSLTSQEIDTLRQKLGDQGFKVENFDQRNATQEVAQTARQQHSTKVPTAQPLPTVTDKSRIEYVIAPIMRINKDTQQQERVPGMFALSIFTEGQRLGHRTLNRNERDLLNNKPGEITNVINAKFAKELQGVTLDFRQVHRPAVPDEQWNSLSLPNGMTLLAMPRMTRNDATGKYELTAKVEGMTLGPKPMFRQDVNDFFDHARPAAEIVARVFREELKLQNLHDTNQLPTSPRQSADELISLWQNAKQDGDDHAITFVQREGKFGMFYQTFDEDAKNMSKVTNRSLKVIDTDTRKNVVYANVPQEQILDIFRQLRKAGFQPLAVNSEGKAVGIAEEQKVAPQRTVPLTDGRKLEDISLRNANGKWLMTANIDGKPLPEREITRDDATIFKQGQQTMSDIVLKYYTDDFSHPQPSQTVKHSLGR